ncbi:hypothetical protein Pcinc_029630 [Petrolisthes cinctipes]|uniref:Uncharacterized protein n=1 Tax=Petrolisthes cinctipes TaxID=88211 RepID=A0AAE1K7J2_PETCI|nr:hypothetical protein Pcinc_029630 [Petrolisthes cinctipes]
MTQTMLVYKSPSCQYLLFHRPQVHQHQVTSRFHIPITNTGQDDDENGKEENSNENINNTKNQTQTDDGNGKEENNNENINTTKNQTQADG